MDKYRVPVHTASFDGKVMLLEMFSWFFAGFYYRDELKAEMDQSGLFEEKQRSESRFVSFVKSFVPFAVK